MPCSIAIVGAGWYGCHIASVLTSFGFDVRLFDANTRPLLEASGNNQFRLHLGFHYPRHNGTRVQSRDGFARFMRRYPSLSRAVVGNYYAIARNESLLDFETYKAVMASSGVGFRTVDSPTLDLREVEGVLDTDERVLNTEAARQLFMRRLGNVMALGQRVSSIQQDADGVRVDGKRYDFVVDATWGHLTRPDVPLFYEPTMLLYYEGPLDHPALTIVDGPLCSVYPTEDPKVYTLSSVTHTPLGQTDSAAQARRMRDEVSSDMVEAVRQRMCAQIERYLPSFAQDFRFLGPQLAIKTKPMGLSDNRSCSVQRFGRVISVMSGKIDTIFYASDCVLDILSEFLGGDILLDAGDFHHPHLRKA